MKSKFFNTLMYRKSDTCHIVMYAAVGNRTPYTIMTVVAPMQRSEIIEQAEEFIECINTDFWITPSKYPTPLVPEDSFIPSINCTMLQFMIHARDFELYAAQWTTEKIGRKYDLKFALFMYPVMHMINELPFGKIKNAAQDAIVEVGGFYNYQICDSIREGVEIRFNGF